METLKVALLVHRQPATVCIPSLNFGLLLGHNGFLIGCSIVSSKVERIFSRRIFGVTTATGLLPNTD
jgi:hypothetical protein